MRGDPSVPCSVIASPPIQGSLAVFTPTPARGAVVCELSVLLLNQPRCRPHPEMKKQVLLAASHPPRTSPLKP